MLKFLTCTKIHDERSHLIKSLPLKSSYSVKHIWYDHLSVVSVATIWSVYFDPAPSLNYELKSTWTMLPSYLVPQILYLKTVSFKVDSTPCGYFVWFVSLSPNVDLTTFSVLISDDGTCKDLTPLLVLIMEIDKIADLTPLSVLIMRSWYYHKSDPTLSPYYGELVLPQIWPHSQSLLWGVTVDLTPFSVLIMGG